MQFIKSPPANARALHDGDMLLFVCSFVCLFVSLTPFKSVKSFAMWQHMAASEGLSYRVRCTCSATSRCGGVRTRIFQWGFGAERGNLWKVSESPSPASTGSGESRSPDSVLALKLLKTAPRGIGNLFRLA